jgi:uncharacterized protein YdaU (DUF1376 family)
MKNPAFPLYVNDFYVDTITWELDELGLYTRLLFIQWANGPLENDPKKLAKIANISLKKFKILFKMSRAMVYPHFRAFGAKVIPQ